MNVLAWVGIACLIGVVSGLGYKGAVAFCRRRADRAERADFPRAEVRR